MTEDELLDRVESDPQDFISLRKLIDDTHSYLIKMHGNLNDWQKIHIVGSIRSLMKPYMFELCRVELWNSLQQDYDRRETHIKKMKECADKFGNIYEMIENLKP